MAVIFYIFAALLVYFSFKSLLSGIDYLYYFKRQLADSLPEYTPFATVVAPCRDIDDGLEANLAALFEQDYPAYEIIFVVDDENDPAVKVIATLVSRNDAGPNSDQQAAILRDRGKIPARIVVAPRSSDSSQKVENLREAVLHADSRSEAFVFVDSDARPAKYWLGSLVAPLRDQAVGAATGYRWFIPDKSTIAGELRSAWNASAASALGSNTQSNFCWGGSTAIRKATFELLDVREKWIGTLSDDFTVTRAVNAAGLSVHFVPQALTPSRDSCTFREMLEFTTRQMKITRVYSPRLWLTSFLGSALFTFLIFSAILILVLGQRNTPLVWASIAMLVLVSIFGIGKAYLRLAAVQMVIPEARKQLLPQLALWAVAPPLFFYNCVRALISRKLTWRGIRYELVSEKQTRRIG